MVNTAITFMPDYLAYSLTQCTVFGKKKYNSYSKKIYQTEILWSDFGHTQRADGVDERFFGDGGAVADALAGIVNGADGTMKELGNFGTVSKTETHQCIDSEFRIEQFAFLEDYSLVRTQQCIEIFDEIGI